MENKDYAAAPLAKRPIINFALRQAQDDNFFVMVKNPQNNRGISRFSVFF